MPCKRPYITRSCGSRSRNQPTNSAEEAEIDSRHERRPPVVCSVELRALLLGEGVELFLFQQFIHALVERMACPLRQIILADPQLLLPLSAQMRPHRHRRFSGLRGHSTGDTGSHKFHHVTSAKKTAFHHRLLAIVPLYGIPLRNFRPCRVAHSAERCPRESFPRLPSRPFGRRVCSHTEVNHATPVVRQNHEDKRKVEENRWNHEEVGSDKILHVVLEKCPPRLRRRPSLAHHVVGNRGWR